MFTRNPLSRLIALLTICALAGVGGVAFLVLVARPTTAAPTDDRVVAVGGLQYEAMLARPLHPSHPVDRAITAGLRPREKRLRHGQMLFGTFLAVSNDTLHGLRTADRIELRDDAGDVFRPLRAPAGNPYAYVPRSVPPKTRLPRMGTPAHDNLAAQGWWVAFRIPAFRFEEGTLELIIHAAGDQRQVAYLGV